MKSRAVWTGIGTILRGFRFAGPGGRFWEGKTGFVATALMENEKKIKKIQVSGKRCEIF